MASSVNNRNCRRYKRQQILLKAEVAAGTKDTTTVQYRNCHRYKRRQFLLKAETAADTNDGNFCSSSKLPQVQTMATSGTSGTNEDLIRLTSGQQPFPPRGHLLSKSECDEPAASFVIAASNTGIAQHHPPPAPLKSFLT